MHQQNYYLDALEIVSTWDLPDEDLAEAANAQASLMMGINPDDLWESHPEIH
jgi:hypothetical protein